MMERARRKGDSGIEEEAGMLEKQKEELHSRLQKVDAGA
jgi:hypothetical protein